MSRPARRGGLLGLAGACIGLVAGMSIGVLAFDRSNDGDGSIRLVEVEKLRAGAAVEVAVDDLMADRLDLVDEPTAGRSQEIRLRSVWVTLLDGEPVVFANRSTHGGCALVFIDDISEVTNGPAGEGREVLEGPGFVDPCRLITWTIDGEFASGFTTVRALDRLPSWIQSGVVVAAPITVPAPTAGTAEG